MTRCIRVLIVDDSRAVRDLLRAILDSASDIEVVGEAADGQQAIALASTLKPDLITMDLDMPIIPGMQAIDHIMHTKAVPILVISDVADAHNALAAVECGALDVLAKGECTPDYADTLTAKVRLLAGVSMVTRIAPRRVATNLPALPLPPCPTPTFDYPVFAIAASTGGPQALAEILSGLPASFPGTILVAQHIADGFAQGMVDWLAGLCRLPVKLGTAGETLQPGAVFVSPSEAYLWVTEQHSLALQARTESDIYNPNCNLLLHSVARVSGQKATGIILSGMGQDGVEGMAAIHAAKGRTLAQDQSSSIIYGMNRLAVDRGVVQHVLPPREIAARMQAIAQPVPPRVEVG